VKPVKFLTFIFIILFSFILLLELANAYPTLVGTTPYNESLKSSGWSWVQGNYAYVDSDNGYFSVINITDKTAPQVIAYIYNTTIFNGNEGISCNSNYCFTTAYLSNTFNVINITTPTNPSVIFSIKDDQNLHGAESVKIRGNYAYLTALYSEAVVIMNITNPLSPYIFSNYSNSTLLHFCVSSSPVDDLLYTTSSTGAVLTIINISDLTAPSLLNYYSNSSLTHSSNLYVSNGLVYTNGDNNFVILNATNSSNIFQMGIASNSTVFNSPSTIKPYNGNMYMTNYGQSSSLTGFVEVNVSDPTNPTIINFINNSDGIFGSLDDLEIVDNYAYVTDTGSVGKYFIFKLGDDVPYTWTDNGSLAQNIDGCGVLNTSNAVYTQTEDIFPRGTINPCMIINATNITYNGNYHWINNATWNGTAIQVPSLGTGVWSNVNIWNININLRYNSSDIGTPSAKGIQVLGSKINSNFKNIYINSTYHGISFQFLNDSLIDNITLEVSYGGLTGPSFMFNNTFQNIVITNPFRNSSTYVGHDGIQFQNGTYNTFKNLYIEGVRYTINSDGFAVGQANSYWENISVYNSTRCLTLYSTSTSNAVFKDIYLDNSCSTNSLVSFSPAGTNNTFISAVWNSSTESTTNLAYIREGYYQAYVNDSAGNLVSGTNITAYNVTGDYQFNLTTNATGYTPQTTIIDYVSVNGTRTYYSFYNLSAGNLNYSALSHSLNASLGNNLEDNFEFVYIDTRTIQEVEISGGGGGIPIFNPSSNQIDNGYNQNLAAGWKINFKLGGESHQIVANSLSSDSANLIIYSNPVSFTLKLNEEKKIDLDLDGDYDLLIKLNSIIGNTGNFYIKTINEQYSSDYANSSEPESLGNKSVTFEPENNTSGNKFIIEIILIILLFVIILIFIVVIRNRKRRRYLLGYY
jgi:hypothetical protein